MPPDHVPILPASRRPPPPPNPPPALPSSSSQGSSSSLPPRRPAVLAACEACRLKKVKVSERQHSLPSSLHLHTPYTALDIFQHHYIRAIWVPSPSLAPTVIGTSSFSLLTYPPNATSSVTAAALGVAAASAFYPTQHAITAQMRARPVPSPSRGVARRLRRNWPRCISSSTSSTTGQRQTPGRYSSA